MMYAESHPWAVITPPWVVVARGGRWNTVDLRRLYTVERGGARVVSLADVWVASELSGDLFALAFDFLDADGNSASRRGEARLDSTRFVKGWLDVETRDVSWSEDDRVQGHWHMRGVTTVVAVSPSKGSQRPRW
jgi:hypothetical protein